MASVRDLGGWSGVDLGPKQAIADRIIPGPRMLVAGDILCMTGGHGHVMGLEGDPLTDLSALRRLAMVFQAGRRADADMGRAP